VTRRAQRSVRASERGQVVLFFSSKPWGKIRSQARTWAAAGRHSAGRGKRHGPAATRRSGDDSAQGCPGA
jgi:hypothetical protein